jgi:hypothetical protein
VAEDTWPSPRIEPRRLVLGAGGLGDAASPARPLSVCSPQDTGVAAGAWCAFGPGGYPGEQGPDDARSLCLDSAPLSERMEILGAPVVDLELAVDRPVAFLALRLCEVAPDGSSGRVSYALANLTHDERHEEWRPLEPGARRRVRVALNDVAHAFRPGSRIRLALSTAYWPLAWPSPEPVTLTLFSGSGWLELPVRPPRPEDAALPAFLPPETAPEPAVRSLQPGGVRRSLSLDPQSGETRLDVAVDLDEAGVPSLSRIEPIDLDVGYGIRHRFAVHPSDPLAARAETLHVSLVRRGSWQVRVETRTRVCADRERFFVEAELAAHEGGAEVFARRWDERVPRRGI